MTLVRRQSPLLEVWVPGRPAPQGSMTPIRKGPRLGVRSANDAVLKPWRAQIAAVAGDAATTTLDEPLHVLLDFVFRRPKSHYGTGRNAGVVKPGQSIAPMNRGQGDTDKLARAVLDGLTDANVLLDDAIVVQLSAQKLWASSPTSAEGCRVRILRAWSPLYQAVAS